MLNAEILILSLEPEAVVLARVPRRPPASRPVVIDRAPVAEADPATPGADGAVRRWAAALAALGCRGRVRRPVTLLVPPDLLLARHLPAPAVPGRMRERAIGFAAAQALPHPLEETVWDHVASGRAHAAGDLLLLAAKASRVAALCAAAESAGLRLAAAVPAPLATLAGFRLLSGPPAGAAVLLVIPGAGAHEFILAEAGGCAIRVAAAAGAVSPGGLAAEAARTLAAFRNGEAGSGAPDVCLVGVDPAEFSMWRDAFAARFGTEVGRITAGPCGAAELRGRGVVALAAGPASQRADLLPPAWARRARWRRRAPWLAAAGVLLLAGLIPPLAHHRAATETARRTAATLESELAPLRQFEARRTEQRARLESLRRQIAVLALAEVERHRWIDLLADLEVRLATVEDAWLDRLEPLPGDPAGRIAVSGRLLDRAHPSDRAGAATQVRIKTLFAQLADSPHVATVLAERVEAAGSGVVRFECELVPPGPAASRP